jgi:decaprenylphospho-beta-D-ribofuranose 2-oxidase
VVQSGAASFLAVLKSCGAADGGLLSYLEPGHTLALDIPYHPRATPDLCRRLDRILLDHGGRLYLAKDSLMTAATFRAMYPRMDAFVAVKQRVDPTGRFVSSQARRVGLAR